MSDGDESLIAGRYRLDSQVGSGAMGVVWRAVDVRLDRTVAVKQLLLPPGLNAIETEKARQRAFREGRIAARLQHPSAISVYNVADHDGQPVLVMEYLPSRSLSDVLEERGTLPPVDLARIGAQVAAALAVAHDAGVIHRDVKPGNILLADDGTAKITDFGISRAAGDITVTSTGLLAGTPAFLSPETARGAEPGPAADVFSLGATLYAAVEGIPPFENPGNEIAMLHVVAAGRTLPPRQAGMLDEPLRAMLQPEPDARPSMAEVETSLRAIAEGRAPTVADAPTLPPTPVRGSTRVDLHPAAVSAVPAAAAHAQPPVPPGPAPTQTNPPTQLPPGGRSSLESAGARGAGAGSPRARLIATGLAVLAAAAVGILVAELLVGGSDSGADSGLPPGADGSLSTAPNPSVPQTPTQQPSEEQGPSSAPSSPTQQPPSPAELEQAVVDYYSALPDDIHQAWRGLGPGLKEQGKDSYRAFWSSIETVEIVGGPTAVSGHVVEVELTFTPREGDVTRETHRLGMVVKGKRVLIDSDETGSITVLGDGGAEEEDEDEPDEDEQDG